MTSLEEKQPSNLTLSSATSTALIASLKHSTSTGLSSSTRRKSEEAFEYKEPSEIGDIDVESETENSMINRYLKPEV